MRNKEEFIKLLSAIKKTIRVNKAVLHEPSFNNQEFKEVKKAIDSNFVSNSGNSCNKIKEFTKRLKKITKSKYVIPVINGTSALHIILKILKIGSQHEVLVPTLSFVATGNVVLYQNADPHFVDSEPNNLGVDPKKLRSYLNKISKITDKGCINIQTKKIIKCLIVTHVFGHSAKIIELQKICKDFKIILVEDAAEALGTFYKGTHVGNFGTLSALSFNGNKIITTGGGGAILSNNKKLSKIADHISSTAKVDHSFEYIHDQVGYNYKIPNLNAALGCAQLKKLNFFLKKKRKLYACYKKNFQKINFLTLFSEPKDSKSNYWLQTVILKKSDIKFRNTLIMYLISRGIKVRPIWKLLHELKYFKKFQKMNLSNSIKLEKQVINLPSSSSLIQ